MCVGSRSSTRTLMRDTAYYLANSFAHSLHVLHAEGVLGLMSTEMNADAGHKRTVVATEHAYAADLRLHLRDAADRQQDFIMAPLFAPVAPRGASDESGRDGHDVRRQAAGNTPETALSNSQWMSDVVASHAGAAGAGAACHERGGQGSMDYMDCFWLNGLEEELEWASYVGVQAYVGPPPATPVSKAGTGTGASHLPMYAQTVRTSLDRLAGYVQFWLTIPLVSAESASAVHNGEDCFLQWDAFRSLTDYHPRVGVAVQLPEGRGTDSQNSCNELGIDAHWIPPPGGWSDCLFTPCPHSLYTPLRQSLTPSTTIRPLQYSRIPKAS